VSARRRPHLQRLSTSASQRQSSCESTPRSASQSLPADLNVTSCDYGHSLMIVTQTVRHLHLILRLVRAAADHTDGSRIFVWGAKVERRRRELSRRRRRRGSGVWGSGCPLPMGRSLGRGLCPFPRKFLDFFCLGMVYFACILTHD